MEERIKMVLNHIEENIRLDLKLKDLAKIACLSPSQFHRQFKLHTGRTPFKFVEELRMNKAYQMILSKQWKIQELSDEFGYRNYETFSKAFKRYFLFSPDDLRAVVEGINGHVDREEENELMLLTFDEAGNDTDLIQQIKSFLEERKIEVTDLHQASIFKIAPKELVSKKKNQLIKNKFVLTKEDKLWKSLIRRGDQ